MLTENTNHLFRNYSVRYHRASRASAYRLESQCANKMTFFTLHSIAVRPSIDRCVRR